MATLGALLEVVGFFIVILAIQQSSSTLLFTALVVIVSGFSCLQPSLNSLLSRRSDPAKQGVIMGVGQSVNALARIVGSAIGIPILRYQMTAPYWLSGILMAIGAVFIFAAVSTGKDYASADKESELSDEDAT